MFEIQKDTIPNVFVKKSKPLVTSNSFSLPFNIKSTFLFQQQLWILTAIDGIVYKIIDNNKSIKYLNNIKEMYCKNGSLYFLHFTNDLTVIGNNSFGQLGINSYKDEIKELKKVNLTLHKEDIIKFKAGYNTAIIITKYGKLYFSGKNCINNDKDTMFYTFREIRNIPLIKDISIGKGFIILITKTNEIFVRGKNSSGELGLGDLINRSLDFVQVKYWKEENGILNVECGESHSCILTENKEIFVSGSNRYGQLGFKEFDKLLVFTKLTIFNQQIKKVQCVENVTYLMTMENNVYKIISDAFNKDVLYRKEDTMDVVISEMNCDVEGIVLYFKEEENNLNYMQRKLQQILMYKHLVDIVIY
ncbi:hypothetical protein ABK040_001495 [Willaertia magna]